MRLLRGCLLAATGSVAGLLIVEALLRLSGYVPWYLEQRAFIPSKDPRLVWQLRSGFKGLYAAVPISINSMGFRGPELSGPPDPSVFRVVLLGDSIVFGQGVHDDETLAAQLTNRLRAKVAARVEVVNTGVPGYDVCQEAETFREHVDALRPSVAVVVFGENDTDREQAPLFRIAGADVISPDVRTGPLGDLAAALRKHSAAYNFAWTRWYAVRYHPYSVAKYSAILGAKFRVGNPGWERSKVCLTELVRLTRAHSVRLIVMPFPVLAALREKPYPFAHYILTVCDFARSREVPCVDAVPVLQSARLRLTVSAIEPHPSAEVLARVAERLAEVLR